MDILRYCSLAGDVVAEGGDGVVGGVQILVHSHVSCCGCGSRVTHGVVPEPLARIPAKALSVAVLFVQEKRSNE